MTPTIAAVATPPGRGGVGIIRISGPASFSIASKLSHSSSFIAHKAHLRSWFGEDGDSIDRGIQLHFPAPNSYTGDDVVELHAHGNPLLLALLLDRLFQLGAVAAAPGAFTRRAVENGKIDLSQAEAVAAAIEAQTSRAVRQAQKHLNGDFGAHIYELLDEITSLVAHVEACLDFPDEEIPDLFLSDLAKQVDERLIHSLAGLLSTARFGERLFEGIDLAIIGAPNVGKSSLFNRLVGRDRAIVSNRAGTTRDILEVDFDLAGIPVRLMDTAGIRLTDDILENEGVRRAYLAADSADVVLFVADATDPSTWTSVHSYHLAVLNKCDLLSSPCPDGFIAVSALTGSGIDQLVDAVVSHLGGRSDADEGVMITSVRHRQAISTAHDALVSASSLLSSSVELDLAAFHLRHAWSSLSEIVGQGDVETILDQVFSRFCIGK